jgi:flagellar hook-associated protein FlgK
MAKLILYQNAYEAAANVITILDEMMETLINMVE